MAEKFYENKEEKRIDIKPEESDVSSLPEDLSSSSSSVFSYSNQTYQEISLSFRTGFKEFTEEDYQALQQNLILYKEGSLEAGTYITSMFHQFLSKYARFICYGQSNKENRAGQDKSISRFVGLFMPSKKNNPDVHHKDRYKTFAETCGKIKLLFSKFEYWDIYNELVCALLNMAHKYKITQEGDKYHHKNGSFHMYVSKCFHFEAHNVLSKLIEDPLAHTETFHIDDNEFNRSGSNSGDEFSRSTFVIKDSLNENVAGVNRINKVYYLKDNTTEKNINYILDQEDRRNALEQSENLVLNENKELDPFDFESLNFNWTNGTTCSEMFDSLTSYERELIVLSFIKNKTDSEIASIYGCHRVTIVNHKKQAVLKIKKAAINKKLINQKEE